MRSVLSRRRRYHHHLLVLLLQAVLCYYAAAATTKLFALLLFVPPGVDVVAVAAAPAAEESTGATKAQQQLQQQDGDENKKGNYGECRNSEEDCDITTCSVEQEPPLTTPPSSSFDDDGGCNADDSDSEAATTAKATADDGADDEEPRSVHQFLRAFGRLKMSWMHFVAVYKDAFGTAMGANRDGDVWEANLEKGLASLRRLVVAKSKRKASAEKQEDNSDDDDEKRRIETNMWTFRAVPCEPFNRTLDDVYMAFLRWSQVDGTDDEDHGVRGGSNNMDANLPVNVSKALRRLESYARWMETNYGDLMGSVADEPLTAASIKRAYDVFSMRISYDDVGRPVWWFDNGRIDLREVRALARKDVLRLFVWFAHLLMFDERAQRNGIVVVDNLARISFWDFMRMMPSSDLGLQIDSFIISLWPLKKKRVLMTHTPVWFDVMYAVIGIFIPRKMKALVEIVPDINDNNIIEGRVGRDCIPAGFAGMEGFLEEDLIAERYF